MLPDDTVHGGVSVRSVTDTLCDTVHGATDTLCRDDQRERLLLTTNTSGYNPITLAGSMLSHHMTSVFHQHAPNLAAATTAYATVITMIVISLPVAN